VWDAIGPDSSQAGIYWHTLPKTRVCRPIAYFFVTVARRLDATLLPNEKLCAATSQSSARIRHGQQPAFWSC
jgi:hypothetical protein